VWLDDGTGTLTPHRCMEVFVPDDSPLYEGPLNSGSPQYEALPVPQFPGLWIGDQPFWIPGDLAHAELLCSLLRGGAYSHAFASGYDQPLLSSKRGAKCLMCKKQGQGT
jgi:hypothetical protein